MAEALVQDVLKLLVRAPGHCAAMLWCCVPASPADWNTLLARPTLACLLALDKGSLLLFATRGAPDAMAPAASGNASPCLTA
jgi:hypothetical protein